MLAGFRGRHAGGLRLRATDRPVAQIAGECGFETLSHFNQQFKLRYGVSPREFRRLRPP